jgi:hypothetical protein
VKKDLTTSSRVKKNFCNDIKIFLKKDNDNKLSIKNRIEIIQSSNHFAPIADNFIAC